MFGEYFIIFHCIILFYFILFYFILFYFIYFILFCFVLFWKKLLLFSRDAFIKESENKIK